MNYAPIARIIIRYGVGLLINKLLFVGILKSLSMYMGMGFSPVQSLVFNLGLSCKSVLAPIKMACSSLLH